MADGRSPAFPPKDVPVLPIAATSALCAMRHPTFALISLVSGIAWVVLYHLPPILPHLYYNPPSFLPYTPPRPIPPDSVPAG
jgi:hypothetical protein